MSILSSDVNQLEDVISDSSTSIIRLIITRFTAFVILFLMSWKLVAVLFGPLLLIFPLVWWFSTRVQRKYRKQRESTGDINSILENSFYKFLNKKFTCPKVTYFIVLYKISNR